MRATPLVLLWLAWPAECFGRLPPNRPNRTGLCVSDPVDLDCSFLTEPVASNSCTLKFFATNGTDCQNLDLDTEPSGKRADLGRFQLAPFLFSYNKDYNATVFNISFSDIKWKQLSFKFMLRTDKDHLKNHCRSITASGDPVQILPFGYDCYWSDQDRRYQSETFILKILAQNGDLYDLREFVFKVPKAKENENFAYVDLSDSKKAILHFSPSSKTSDVSQYWVQLCHNISNPDPECETVKYQDEGYSIEPKESRIYFFRIVDNTTGTPPWPSFNSAEFKMDVVKYSILWQILFSLLAFGILFFLVWIVARCRRRFVPRVLLLYPHNDKSHLTIIKLFRDYMQTVFGWKVMFDEDIEYTEHRDPYIWCLDSCLAADSILYVCVPLDCPTHSKLNEDNTATVNIHMDDLFLKAINIASQQRKINLYNVVLGSCGEADMPLEFRKMPTFKVLERWYDLMHVIAKNNWFDKRFRPMPELDKSSIGQNILKMCSKNP